MAFVDPQLMFRIFDVIDNLALQHNLFPQEISDALMDAVGEPTTTNAKMVLEALSSFTSDRGFWEQFYEAFPV